MLLGQEDIDPTVSDKGGLTPLIHAAEAGEEGVVKLLLERGNAIPICRASTARHHYHMRPDLGAGAWPRYS